MKNNNSYDILVEFLSNEPFVFFSTKYQDFAHRVIKIDILILDILIKLDNVEIFRLANDKLE